MYLSEVFEYIVVNAIYHVFMYVLIEDSESEMEQAQVINQVTGELFWFSRTLCSDRSDKIIPALTASDASEMAKNLAFSLVVQRDLVRVGADRGEIVAMFKEILPQVYTDLLNDGEVLEAHLPPMAC